MSTSSPTLYLASQSPRRASLIRLLGVKQIEIRPTHSDESFDEATPPNVAAKDLASRKAHALRDVLLSQGAAGVIVGADTMVALDEHVLNKPTDELDAERMLTLLSGRTHRVYTGVSILDVVSGREDSFVEATSVTFRPLGSEEIRSYIATGAPMDKAGSYGIQEDFGAVFVRRIDGDYYNVVGLPIAELYIRLRQFAPELFG